MKFALIACAIAALVIGSVFPGFGQDSHALSLPDNSYDNQKTGLGTTSKNATSTGPSATPDAESNTAEHDDSLYRGKTSESENPMLRDEGALHFKTHPKERIREVDSLKSLQSSGTDPKFQGSFITSGVSSINTVAEKANSIEVGDAQFEQPRDTHSVKRHMTFPAEQDEKSAKPAADSSPSPSPSSSASPATKKSNDSKK